MNMIPCRKCPQCGIFNDFTVEECECGKILNDIGVQLIDTDEVSPEQYGEIDTSLRVFVQKCSACGTLNYTDNPAHPVKVCCNCHKTRIATIDPVECVEECSEKIQDTFSPETDELSDAERLDTQQVRDHVSQSQQISDDDDDDDGFARWQDILSNIKKTVGGEPEGSQAKSNQQEIQQLTQQQPSDFDDDDDEVGDWSDILGVSQDEKVPKPEKQEVSNLAPKDITLTAIRYGRLSFTVEVGQEIYMLGRSANQGSFLSQDGRVGNEHCYLFFKDGAWFVKDNNSRNGTAVNSRDIGLNGECMLSDGDELKLGHHPDSIAFRITIT